MKKSFSIPLTIPLTLFLLMAELGVLSSYHFAAGQGTTTVVGGVGANPGGANGQIQYNNNGVFGGFGTFNSGTQTLTVTALTASNTISGFTYITGTKCAAVGSAANPSVAACANAAAGVFSCSTSSAGNCQVNTGNMTGSNTTILIWQDASTAVGTLLGVTCNTTISSINPVITARSAAVSFSFSITTPVTNPDCFQYLLVN